MATPKMRARGKTIASKNAKLTSYDANHKPSVQIIKCIGFQKFRYCGEDRPGKKYQEKDFLQLSLHNMSGKNVIIQILCFDADDQFSIHPNGLVGRDCAEGIYRKVFPISKATQIQRIPYLRTERIRTKKNESDNLKKTLLRRAELLPSPFKERCRQQCDSPLKFDTTKVCFGVIATLEGVKGEPLFVISNVVQNASEKTKLEIKKLSTKSVSAQDGGEIDIFTIEDGPPIMDGKCSVKVIVSQHNWESEETKPKKDQILYKRVVTYQVPPLKAIPVITSPVQAELKLSCLQSGQSCTFSFFYEPAVGLKDSDLNLHWSKPPRKRPYVVDDDEFQRINGADNIKLRVKEKVQSRQSQDIDQMHDLHERDARSTLDPKAIIPVTVNQVLHKDHAQAISVSKENQPQLQNDIIWATDAITGELVYLRTNTPGSENVVVYVDDGERSVESVGSLVSMPGVPEVSAPKAVAVPVSEWDTMVSQTSGSVRTLATLNTPRSAGEVHIPDSGAASVPKTTAARRKSILSPWLVTEPELPTPLMHGDVHLPAPLPFITANTSAPPIFMKQESVDYGTLSSRTIDSEYVIISSETVPEVSNSLPSLQLSSFLTSGGLESNLKGMKFDDSGTLLSSSVFEMVEPYLNKV